MNARRLPDGPQVHPPTTNEPSPDTDVAKLFVWTGCGGPIPSIPVPERQTNAWPRSPGSAVLYPTIVVPSLEMSYAELSVLPGRNPSPCMPFVPSQTNACSRYEVVRS